MHTFGIFKWIVIQFPYNTKMNECIAAAPTMVQSYNISELFTIVCSTLSYRMKIIWGIFNFPRIHWIEKCSILLGRNLLLHIFRHILQLFIKLLLLSAELLRCYILLNLIKSNCEVEGRTEWMKEIDCRKYTVIWTNTFAYCPSVNYQLILLLLRTDLQLKSISSH